MVVVVFFWQFYDAEYGNKADNNFHISPPNSTYDMSTCLSFHNGFIYVQHYHIQSKIEPTKKGIPLFEKKMSVILFVRQCSKWKYVKNTKSAVCC